MLVSISIVTVNILIKYKIIIFNNINLRYKSINMISNVERKPAKQLTTSEAVEPILEGSVVLSSYPRQ